jgi:hypothetical protein
MLTFNRKLFVIASGISLWTTPAQASDSASTAFTGQVPVACSIIRLDSNQSNSNRFTLANNRGSVTTLCNTANTLSVTVDKVASPIELQNAKIRFTGGTGIYANASSSYQDTASFSSQQTTTAAGDTAQLEVDTVAPRAYSIVVYASITPQ